MRILFVVNPRAARVSFNETCRLLRTEFRGHDVVLGSTVEQDLPGAGTDGGALSRSGLPIDLVVAVGGDGTVNRVINALGGRNVPVGILPAGRANDFARNLGIPLHHRTACQLLHRPAIAHVDLVSVNGRLIGTSGGVGLVGAVSARAVLWRRGRGVRAWTASRLGAACYPAATLVELLAGTGVHRGRLSLDGRPNDVAAVVVSNQPRFGRWFTTVPVERAPRDGLRLCIVDAPRTRRRLLGICVRAATTGLSREPGVSVHMTRRCTLRFDEDVDFFGDGEFLMRGRRFDMRVLPGVLPLVVDPASRLAGAA